MSEPTAVVRVTGRAGLLGSIPVLLGYHPVDSVVIACMTGEDNKIGPVIRVDLSFYQSGPEPLADQLAGFLTRYADNAVLVFYGIDEDPIGFAEMLNERGGCIRGTEFVDNTPQLMDTHLVAENVGLGRVVTDTREGLRARVEFDKGATRMPDPGLVLAMRDKAGRDEFLAAHIGDAGPALARVLQACRWIEDEPEDGANVTVLANLCTVAAILTYREGNGALAQICLDRALRAQPAHQLAHLMLAALSAGMPPLALDALVGEL